MELLTLKQAAARAGLKESTARYYRDSFPEFIPSIGEGRARRYKPEIVEVFRVIAEEFKRNHNATTINDQLARLFTRVYTVEVETQRNNATTTQPSLEGASEAEKEQIALLRSIAELLRKQQETQKTQVESLLSEIALLRSRVWELEKRLALPASAEDLGQGSKAPGVVPGKANRPWWRFWG